MPVTMEDIFHSEPAAAKLLGIKHEPAGRIENGLIFLDAKANNDVFVLWRLDVSPPIELLYEKNMPDPDGYPTDTVEEVLIWCNRCNRESMLNLKREEEDNGLRQRAFLWDPMSTTVAMLKVDELTDLISTPAFFLFSYPNENSLLEKSWKRLYWEKLKLDVLPEDSYVELNESHRKQRVHDMRMLVRYDPLVGRTGFIKLFTTHKDAVLAKLQEYKAQRLLLDTQIDMP